MTLAGKRGEILDRFGESLAITAPVKSLFLDPAKVEDPWGIAKRVAPRIGRNWKPLYDKIRAYQRKGRRFLWVARHLNEKQYQNLKSIQMKGMYFREERRRYYPHGTLASHLIGFTNIDGQGIEGLEKSYNFELLPRVIREEAEKDAKGRPITSSENSSLTMTGNSLELTIDKSLQFHVEEVLQSTIEKSGAKAATAIVMNADNGHIYALANVPTYSLADPTDSKIAHRRNRAITDVYEPGSTLKPITAAIAIEEGVFDEESLVFGEYGKLKIGGYTIHEPHQDERHKFGWMNLADIIARSSNIGSTKIAFKVEPVDFREALFNYGFGKDTGLSIPGEASGTIPPLKEVEKPIVQSNLSFGQGIAVTPLQLIRVYAAIANGGYLLKPQIVQRVKSSSGEVIQRSKKQVERQIFNQETTDLLTRALLGVTGEFGTGKNARVEPFQVAGKTGTSQKAGPNGYLKHKYVASFIGFVPNVEKKLVALVTVDEPDFPYYGNSVAAPAFSEIMKTALLRYKQSPARQPIAALPLWTPEDENEKNIRELAAKEKKARLVKTAIERGDRIRSRSSALMKEDSLRKDLAENKKMPNLKGLMAREVLKLFGTQKIELRIEGRGFVTQQIPKAGKKLGERVTVYLQER
jgi:cell division protein FtsI (penicillin-binding protein 3)